MISQEQEQYNHRKDELSTASTEDRRTANPPARLEDGLPARTTAGFTPLDIEELSRGCIDPIEELVRLKYEGLPLPATTDKPRLVTRGPHPNHYVAPPPSNNRHTIIDTLSFTAKEPYWLMQELLELCCPGLSFIKLKSGFNSYHSGFVAIKDKAEVAKIFYGSKSNEKQNEKPQILIGGNGKSQMIDWHKFFYYASLMEAPTVKNVHIAYDVFDGSLTIEAVANAHIQERFKNPKSPKNPIIKPIGQIQPDGYNPGRTLYIGSQKSNKFIRFYEKGYEMFKGILTSEQVIDQPFKEIVEKSIAEGQDFSDPAINDGQVFALNQWVRAEIEFSDTNCTVPLDILINHDDYFSEAYPFTQELLSVAEGKLIPRLKPKHELDFLIRVENIKKIAGSTIDDMLILGWSNDDIVEALKGGKGASQKLIRSGAYAEG